MLTEKPQCFVDELIVTAVTEDGFFYSTHTPMSSNFRDSDTFCSWNEIGKSTFFSETEAEDFIIKNFDKSYQIN